jgi:hypothetical protein
MSSAVSPETEKVAFDSNRTMPELLAPAGDWNCARAAVENGADAIYFGLDKFNARMRAHNFTESDLPRLMEFLHRRGVRGYITFNTLVFENELADAESYLRTIIAAGVDAAIVQDVGVAHMIRALSPDFPIHASTQMTITSAAGIEFARELGCNLVVLARECSIKEIEKINGAAGPTVSTLVQVQNKGNGMVQNIGNTLKRVFEGDKLLDALEKEWTYGSTNRVWVESIADRQLSGVVCRVWDQCQNGL